MTITGVAVWLVLGWAEGSTDPSELVRRLGSDREPERAAAEAALETLGREAVPLLRVATDSQNPAIRARAAAILERITGDTGLLRPTLVTLDFRDRPLAEVVNTIRRRSGLPVSLFPEDSPLWEGRRVTLREKDSVPFLEAIDRVCEAGRLHISLWQSAAERDRPVGLRLVDFQGDRGPVSRSGPFRVVLLSVHDHHDLILEEEFRLQFDPRTQPPSRRPPADPFSVRLQVMAEPRMAVKLDRSPRWVEAVDDRDQSLVPTEPAGRQGVSFGTLAPSVISFSASLKHLDKPGKSIRRLRGVVPLTVFSRKPGPLVVSLKDAAGRKAEGQGLALEIREIRADAGQPWTMKLFARTEDPRDDTAVPTTWLQESQFELIDGDGQPLPSQFSFSYVERSMKAVTLRLLSSGDTRTPAELRCYGLSRSTAEVPFEFTDVPMP